MNLATPSSSSLRRGFKIPVPVFAAFIAILAIIAGWFVYNRAFRVQDVDFAKYESLNTPTARARQQFIQRTNRDQPANAGLGVLKRNDGFDVQIVGARARFTRENDKLLLNVRFTDNSLFNGNDRAATVARFVALRTPQAATEAKVTPEQLEKLRAIDVPREMTIPADARSKLLELGQRYAAAPEDQQKPIEGELTETFRTIAAAALQPTVAAYADSAKRVREVLNPQQINALRADR
jgi:hypothetical protein